MSTTVDQKVVEMRFDNRQFESNVQTTMSTLDKLKQKLNLNGAAKGLNDINHAAKNVNMSGLSGAVETVTAKFSAMQVIGITALTNVTNSAINAGKRIVSALTIDPVRSGFQEYETQINAVQTILANTQKEGTTIKQVNAALDELNAYADKTIYNFTEMTRNIGTFTAAGVDLKTSVSAIQGIANLAAVSGSTSQQASVAMYQLSQALASGTVKLMDWNSVVNAGMGGQVFQDALRKTSEELQTGAEAAIKAQGSFRESLSTGWLTSEVLTKTLKKFTTSGANEYIAEFTGLSQEAIEAEIKKTESIEDETIAIDKAAESIANMSGKSKEEIKQALQFAKTAEDAATKVKTFTQLWDVLKEAAQSGWAQTWRLIVGDFEEAKGLFTPLADFLTNIINKMSDARNKVLEIALNSPFAKILEKIKQVTSATEKVVEATKDYSDIVNRVINGEFGHGQSRWDKLTEMGYDWAKVQNLVNEQLGNSVRHNEGLDEAQKELNKTQAVTIEQMAKMSRADLGRLGMNYLQINALKDLQKQADRAGYSLSEVIENPELLSGRNLLINGFKDIGNSLITIFQSIRKAWVDIFNPSSTEEKAQKLYELLGAFKGFTSGILEKVKANSDNLTRTFKGLFAIIDIITTFVGGGFKMAFKVVSRILEAFDLNILDVTASIGDAIVSFRDWLFENNSFVTSINSVIDKIPAAVERIKELVTAFLELPAVSNAIDNFKEIGWNIITGLLNGLGDGLASVVNFVAEIGSKIIEAICGVLGIHSPSTVMYEVGGNIVTGLVNGISDGSSWLWEKIKEIASGIIEFFKNIDWDKVLTFGFAGVLLVFSKKLIDITEALTAPLEGLGDLMSGAGEAMSGFAKLEKGIAMDFKAKAFKKMAISIAILVGALIALTFFDPKELWNAVLIIGALSAILVALAFAMNKISDVSVSLKDGKIEGLKSGLIGIAASLLMLAVVVKLIGGMDADSAKKGFIGLTALMVEMGLFMFAFAKLSGYQGIAEADKVGTMFRKMATAMLLMVVVVKLISWLKPEEILKGLAVIEAFVLIFGQLAIVNYMAGSANTAGKTMKKMAVAMMLMVGVVKLISLLKADEIVKGLAVIEMFVLIFAELALVNRIAGKDSAKMGGTILAMSASMLMLAFVAKIVGGIPVNKLAKGIVAVQLFAVIIAELILAVRLAGDNPAKMAGTILAMSIAIGLLAAVSIILGLVDTVALAKGIVAVGMLAAIMSGMIIATRGANDCKANLIVMTVAIGLLVAAVVGLSFVEPKKLAGATAAMSLLMGMFALMTKAAGSAQGSVKTMIALAAIVVVLGGVVVAISLLSPEAAIKSTTALSILLLSMAGVVFILSKIDVKISSALKGVLSLALLAVPLLAFVGVLKLMDGVKNAMSNVLALVTLTGALTLLLIPLTVIGTFISSALSGVLSLTLMAVPLLAFVGILKLMEGIDGAMANVLALTMLLTTVGDVLFKISLVAPLAVVGVAAIAALTGVMLAVGVLAVAIGALMEKFPSIQTFLDTGIPVLVQLAGGIGEMIGAFVAGIAEGILNILPAFGQALSDFMTNASIFIEKAALIDSTVLEGIGYLSGAILVLTAANLISGIGEFLSFGQSFVDLGTHLSDFMTNASPFIEGVKSLDEGTLAGINTLAETILLLTASSVLDGISKIIGQGTSLSEFGATLIPFAHSMVRFSEIVSGNIDEESANAAANVGKILGELQKSLPRKGGWIQDVIGEVETLDSFGAACEAFGESIAKFSKSVTGENAIDPEATSAAANAGKLLAELEKSLPRKGGWLQDIVGETDLAAFGDSCEAFGESIAKFSKSVTGENAIDVAATEAAAKAGTLMSELENSIPKQGGWVQDIMGEQDLKDFGGKIEAFGDSMVNFSDKIGDGINTEAVSSAQNAGLMMAELDEAIPSDKWFDGKVPIDEFGEKIESFGESLVAYSDKVTGMDVGKTSSSITQAYKLGDLANKVVDLDTSGISSFKKVTGIADAMKSYSDKIEGIDSSAVTSSVTDAVKLRGLVSELKDLDTSGIDNFKVTEIGAAMKEYSDKVSSIDEGKVNASVLAALNLKNFIASLSGLQTGGVYSFKTALDTLATVQIDKFVEAFESAGPKVSSSGKKIVDFLTTGITSGSPKVIKAATNILNQLYKSFTSKASSFMTLGSMFMSKLATGIMSKSSSVGSAVSTLLGAAVSRILGYYSNFYNSGTYVGTGLVRGILAKQTDAYNAGFKLGQKAIQGERDGQKSHSPSKLAIQSGEWIGEGLIIGMDSLAAKVYNTGYSLGDTAAKSISSTVAKISDYVTNSVDSTPTIRPVLDLSDVESGVGLLDGMFGNDFSVGAVGRVNAISSSMNGVLQNGANDDLISAIKNLGKTLGGRTGDTYNVNGVTYDDGSNVSNAVESLVRAVRIGKRV